jgi:hypothetical protein
MIVSRLAGPYPPKSSLQPLRRLIDWSRKASSNAGAQRTDPVSQALPDPAEG